MEVCRGSQRAHSGLEGHRLGVGRAYQGLCGVARVGSAGRPSVPISLSSCRAGASTGLEYVGCTNVLFK